MLQNRLPRAGLGLLLAFGQDFARQVVWIELHLVGCVSRLVSSGIHL